ncbi:MAG: deoxyribose-phosphate aldolase [Planctomycetes bacterium]|nr:deoxyribose-phosphate aldolase [Planctomycetota bacterium]
MSADVTLAGIAKMIDHSLLHPTMTDKDIQSGCELAKKYRVATACVKPYATAMAAKILAGSGVGVCPVVAFPHGNSPTAIKVRETEHVVRDGACEVDMVINVGKALGGDWDYVASDIKAVNDAAVSGRAILKVIFETDYLQDEHIIRLCKICSEIRVAFVKTSTGYGFVKQADGNYNYKGATDHNLALMRKNCPAGIQIKAAGGVRTLDDLLRVRTLGVSRIGATATQAIIEEAQKRGIK